MLTGVTVTGAPADPPWPPAPAFRPFPPLHPIEIAAAKANAPVAPLLRTACICFTFRSSRSSQRRFDRRAQLSVIWLDAGGEGADHFAVLADQILVKVPLRLAMLGGQELVNRRLPRP